MTKSSFIPAVFMLLTGILFTACKKEEAPSFSEQLTGNWKSQSVNIDGTDASTIFASDVNLKADGSFTLKVNYTDIFTGQPKSDDYTGNWQSDETAQVITLNFDDAPTQTWKISGFSETAMTADYSSEDGKKFKVTFKKQ